MNSEALFSLPVLRDVSPRGRAWLTAATAPMLILGAACVATQSLAPAAVLPLVNLAVLVLLLAVCSVTDCRWHRIPNWATYPALGWALALNGLVSATRPFAEGMSLSDAWAPIGVAASFKGAAVCFGVMCLVYRIAGSGAGDVKLATALGALLGPTRGLEVIVWCHVLAGVVILSWLIWTIGPWTSLAAFTRYLASKLLPQRVLPPCIDLRRILSRPVPLAAFFAVGTLVTLCM